MGCVHHETTNISNSFLKKKITPVFFFFFFLHCIKCVGFVSAARWGVWFLPHWATEEKISGLADNKPQNRTIKTTSFNVYYTPTHTDLLKTQILKVGWKERVIQVRRLSRTAPEPLSSPLAFFYNRRWRQRSSDCSSRPLDSNRNTWRRTQMKFVFVTGKKFHGRFRMKNQ